MQLPVKAQTQGGLVGQVAGRKLLSAEMAQEGKVGSVGVEPTPQRLKGVYAAVTPRPREGDAAFEAEEVVHFGSSGVSMLTRRAAANRRGGFYLDTRRE